MNRPAVLSAPASPESQTPLDTSFGLKLRAPTAEERAVLGRINAQRERLYELGALRAEQRALLRARQGLPLDASMALRAVVFAKQHPLALAAVVGAAAIAGPKRLMHWAGVALPLLLRLRAQR